MSLAAIFSTLKAHPLATLVLLMQFCTVSTFAAENSSRFTLTEEDKQTFAGSILLAFLIFLLPN